jgi:hypothetical protein
VCRERASEGCRREDGRRMRICSTPLVGRHGSTIPAKVLTGPPSAAGETKGSDIRIQPHHLHFAYLFKVQVQGRITADSALGQQPRDKPELVLGAIQPALVSDLSSVSLLVSSF